MAPSHAGKLTLAVLDSMPKLGLTCLGYQSVGGTVARPGKPGKEACKQGALEPNPQGGSEGYAQSVPGFFAFMLPLRFCTCVAQGLCGWEEAGSWLRREAYVSRARRESQASLALDAYR